MRDKLDDLEMLSRLAARLAGRDPDEHLTIKLAEEVVFDDPLWRYSDFMDRAATAYEILGGNMPGANDDQESTSDGKQNGAASA